MSRAGSRLNDNGIGIVDCPVTPELLTSLLKRIDDGTISGKIAKTVFEELWQTGKPVDTIMQVSRFVNPQWLVEVEADAVVAEVD